MSDSRPTGTSTARIVLASTSPYRRELLQRLRLPFDVVSPGVDEAVLPGETPSLTARRLAAAKAAAVAAGAGDAVVIGSDQAADLDGQIINKPETHERALEQLRRLQGRTAVFHSALAVLHRGHLQSDVVSTSVRFRSLPDAALEAYLRLDRPYDCAGSAKIESLGICLVEAVHSDDPTALIGLPLIRLIAMLEACGIRLPAAG
jgi:septum formation protein